MPNATPYAPQGRYGKRRHLGHGTTLLTVLLLTLFAPLPPAWAGTLHPPQTASPTHTLHPPQTSASTDALFSSQAPAWVGGVQGRVALIGVPGLEWSDLSQSTTPNLWRLVGEGASASLSTRAVPPPDRGITCPTAGWLTISAGQRSGTPGKGCPPPPTPQQAGEGATIPTWRTLTAYQSETGYNAQLGTLGQLVTDNGGKVAAVGPGAALAAANKSGNIARYTPTLDGLGDTTPYSLIVLEAAALADAWTRQPLDEYGVPTPLPASARRAAVAQADQQIGALIAELQPGTTVLVAGISDVTPNAHLHVAIATGPSPTGRPYPRGHLTATSTRQDALVTITDLTATTIQLLGVPTPRDVVGRAWQPGAPAPSTPSETMTELADADLASQVLREVRGPFFTVLVTVQLLFYAFAALALRRRRTTRPNTERPNTERPNTERRSTGHPNATPADDHSAQPGPRLPNTDSHPNNKSLSNPDPDPKPLADPGSPSNTEPLSDPGLLPTTGSLPKPKPLPDTESLPDPGARPDTKSPTYSEPRNSTESFAGAESASTSKLLVAVQIVAVVSGAIAVSTFLAQLVPWWTLPVPMLSVIITILAIAGLITGAAFAGPWRAHVLGPLTVVTALTSLALLLDVMTGSKLQVNAVTGYEPVTGGRFYGFSNIAFAVYATGTILGLAGLAQWLLGRGVSKVVVVSACALYGGFAVFADGWPSWGADFGGVPAFVIGLAVFLILLSGRRVSLLRLLLVGLAGAVLVGGLSVFDWLRPDDQRTHLGNFVQQIIDGQAWTVVSRKFGAMIGVTVGNWSLTLLSLVALAFLFLVLARPSRWGAPALGLAYKSAPTLRAGLFGALTCAFVGFLMNDSGIAIPAMALTVAVPLTLAACVRALQLATPTPPAPPSEQATPRQAEA
ncbi:hypothetical protein [Nonomuraea sp. NPDC050643]|uniref:hypothetical protein n=1 Tax=Nonomuraea sp. NPDC050643 TaxID=3155660 RepID=UPI0033D96F68